MDAESKAKHQKRLRNIATMKRVRNGEIFKSYGLDNSEIARTRTFTAGDPVSNYVGYPDVQAQMIVDEKETKGRIKEQFDKVVDGIAKILGKGPERTA